MVPYRSGWGVVGIGLLLLGSLLLVLAANDRFDGRPSADLLPLAGTALLILLVGIVCAVAGYRTRTTMLQLQRDAPVCEAKITAIRESRMQLWRGRMPRSWYLPWSPLVTWVIEYVYTDASGGTRHGTSGYLDSREVRRWRVGDKALIRVDSKRPDRSVWTGTRPTAASSSRGRLPHRLTRSDPRAAQR